MLDLGIGDDDFELVREALDAKHLPRRRTALIVDEDVVGAGAGSQGTRVVVRCNRPCYILVGDVRLGVLLVLQPLQPTGTDCRTDEQALVLRGFLVDDVGDGRSLRHWDGGRELEIDRLSESADDDSLSLLGTPVVQCIEDLVMHIIASLLEMANDDLECPSAVVGSEVADILKHEGLWLLRQEDFFDVEEQCPLGLMGESFLVADYAERLTGESSEEDVEVRNRLRRYLRDVALGLLSEVGFVGLCSARIPLRGEDTAPAKLLIGKPDSADAGEQVDEGKLTSSGLLERNVLDCFGCFQLSPSFDDVYYTKCLIAPLCEPPTKSIV